MASKPIITEGIPSASGAGGAVPIRREIRSLEKDFPHQWTLYVLGLQEFQGVDENDERSYYQIAGIHGRPYTTYNGAKGTTNGYCTHESILFPTWHRPYLVLFEKVLYKIVGEIAARFPESEGRASYVAAAKDFRIPYWDWAAVLDAETEFVPTSLSRKKLDIVTPDSKGEPKSVDNPLYSFKFHPINPRPGDFPEKPFNSWEETVRWPKNSTTSESQNDLISKARELDNRDSSRTDSSSNLRETLFGLLVSYSSYGPFSNTRWEKENPGQFAGKYGSLESIHDTIHEKVGGRGPPGHMARVPYAAFDPAFWLHHANIDRLFAIWQAMNPDSYVTPQRAKNDTVTTPKGTLEDIATHLTPFWKSSDAFWTSEGVRKTELLSYAYPETQRWNFKTPDEYCKNVRATVKELYGPSSLSWILEQSTPGNLSSRAKLIVPSNAQHDITDLVTNGKYLEWIVNLKVEKHCLDGPFNVPVFLGDFERDDPSKWDSTANIVGSFSVLGDPADTGCGKCQSDRENHSVITGQVPLTLALAERYLGGELTNLESENVIEYLKKHLHWRVIFSDGNEIPRSQVPSLTVSVISNEVTLPGSPEELPRFAKEVTVWPEATTALNNIDGRGDGTGLTDRAQT